MNKFNFSLLFGFALAICGSVQGAETQAPVKSETPKQNDKVTQEREEYNILKRDQVDTTDTLAIPYDDSEVEDEEEVDRIEGKDLFRLPEAKK